MPVLVPTYCAPTLRRLVPASIEKEAGTHVVWVVVRYKTCPAVGRVIKIRPLIFWLTELAARRAKVGSIGFRVVVVVVLVFQLLV